MKIYPITIPKFQHYNSSIQNIQFGKIFDVRKLENVYCPICESTMFNKTQGAEFCAEMSSAVGKELVEVIEKYENQNSDSNNRITKNLSVFNSRQQEILDRIKVAALENEDLFLDEIAYMLGNEVREKYSSLSPRTILSAYQSPYRDSQPILSDEDYADVFFLNCRNREYDSYEVAKEFIKHKYPTIEHLVPASNKGKNEDSNYLCDCSECNANRGSMPFYKWIKQFPNIKENLQIQINQINQAVKDSTLDKKYKYYPQKLAKTIKKLSDGEIDLIA